MQKARPDPIFLRLRGIRTLEEANIFLEEYLPIYNRKFSVSPKEGDNLHRPLERGLNLDAILCKKTQRTLRNDFSVAHNSKLYQVEEAIQASKVMVQDRIDGSLRIYYKDRALRFREEDTFFFLTLISIFHTFYLSQREFLSNKMRRGLRGPRSKG